MPEEKVQCITRVSTIIMNLLSLAQDKSVPAADDFMPVLVFVSLSLNQSICWHSVPGYHQGKPAQFIINGAVCGQLLPRQAGGGGRLLVDAVCGRCGVHQDYGMSSYQESLCCILCHSGDDTWHLCCKPSFQTINLHNTESDLMWSEILPVKIVSQTEQCRNCY